MFSKITVSWLRIVGQGIAFSALVLVLFFLFREGFPDTSKGEGKELLFFLPFFLLTVLGYVLAYFFPARGASMVIAGGVLMMCNQLFFSNYSTALIFGLPFVVSGALTLFATRKSSPKSDRQKIPRWNNADQNNRATT
ncbi:MAG TPA: hypothetical protein VE978_08630 [Chitinophagales bacterium]|nr:hypothetical protein [Chitinophagales bacterium]